MKRVLYFSTMLLLFFLTSTGFTTASRHPSSTDDQPIVISAVAPVYPRNAFKSSGFAVGKVVVEVKIDAKGKVTNAKRVSGHPILGDACESAAKRWQFAEAADSKAIRTLSLTFSFTVRKDNPASPEEDDDALITFTPPYQIEVSKYFLVRTSDTAVSR
jgi:TonB family protein